MDSKLQIAVEILKKYNQEHLLDFYDELDEDKKNHLVNQILSIDFEQIQQLYKNSKKNTVINKNLITPIPYITKSLISKEQYEFYSLIGENAIQHKEIGMLTLAGGKGSRLGYKGPKGSYEIDVPPKKSLFEFICDNLKNVVKNYNIYLPWYIMTSPSNDLNTKQYFMEKNYFGYPKDKIYFFKQHTLPIVDINGKIILDNAYSICEASNGNGDIFKSFADSGLLDNLIKDKIKWISISGVDNIILDVIDPLFIGLSIFNNSSIASKSIKTNINNLSDWVFANVDNFPSIIDPINLSEEMLKSKNKNNQYNYNQINILAHLFSVEALSLLKDIELPYHRAFKKNVYLNEEGMKIVPLEPNSFKFEKFIFDAFKYSKNFTLLEVDANDEFAPIKSFTGSATPETALELYLKKINKE